MFKKPVFLSPEDLEDSEIIKRKKDRRSKKKERKNEFKRLQNIIYEVNNKNNRINWEDYDEQ